MSDELEQARQIVAQQACHDGPWCVDDADCNCRTIAREILAINEARAQGATVPEIAEELTRTAARVADVLRDLDQRHLKAVEELHEMRARAETAELAIAAARNIIAERDAQVKRLVEAAQPFARAATCHAIRPNPHPVREQNIVDGLIWSYADGDNRYELSPLDLRRIAAVLADIAKEALG